ncbi:MAG TPA: hypothetical protein VGC13_22465 [Longimicrobium sp.]|jgi:hypothetical protein|uniref:hypothetical protein n=1 Tax=Longimicrobium sp. TaxID=2029185 RepID=UPI002ED872F6
MDHQLALHLESTRPRLAWGSLDLEERAVAAALRWGRANARQVPEVARVAELSVRKTQKVISQLILVHHWPIGTGMTTPFGNYLIDSAEELEETVTLLHDRAVAELTRAAALRRMSLQDYLRHAQLELRLPKAS